MVQQHPTTLDKECMVEEAQNAGTVGLAVCITNVCVGEREDSVIEQDSVQEDFKDSLANGSCRFTHIISSLHSRNAGCVFFKKNTFSSQSIMMYNVQRVFETFLSCPSL